VQTRTSDSWIFDVDKWGNEMRLNGRESFFSFLFLFGRGIM